MGEWGIMLNVGIFGTQYIDFIGDKNHFITFSYCMWANCWDWNLNSLILILSNFQMLAD